MRKKQWSKLAKDVIEEIEVDREEEALGGTLFFEDTIVKVQKETNCNKERKLQKEQKLSRFEHHKIKRLNPVQSPKRKVMSVDDLWEDEMKGFVAKPKPIYIHPGMSYRPNDVDHTVLVNAVAKEELSKEYMYTPKKEVALIPQQVTLETEIFPAPEQLKLRKVKKDKNKELVVKYEDHRREQKQFFRRILKQLDNLPELLKKIKAARAPQPKSKFKHLKDNVKIGKFYLNDPTPVQLKEDIPSTLREMPNESSALKNMYMTLIKSEKIDYSKYRLNRKQRKTKFITKSAYRMD